MRPQLVAQLTLVLGFGLALLLSVFHPSPAFACSIAPEPDPAQRLDQRLAGAPELVVIGTVTNEVPISSEIVTTTTGAAIVRTALTTGSEQGNTEYQSRVHIEAVLKGDAPANHLVMPALNDSWLCVGGPRLHEGDRVLLLLDLETDVDLERRTSRSDLGDRP